MMFKRFNAYDQGLVAIGEKLEKMSELASCQLADAMRSFVEQDKKLAQRVIDGDEAVDLLDEELEMEALGLISLQQPVDNDLRFLASAMRVSRELERVADYAGDIAKTTLELEYNKPFFKPLIDLPRMADWVQSLLTKSIQAFIHKDVIAARELDQDDNYIDELFVALLEEVTGFMMQGSQYIQQSIRIILVSRYLERIGDHGVNIGEMLIFTETGERHPFKEKAGSEE